MISSTLKSFLHFSALANISFVFVRSNLRVRKNLKRFEKNKKVHDDRSKTTMKNSKIEIWERGVTLKASHHPFFPSQKDLDLSAPPSVYPEFVTARQSSFLHVLEEDGS